MALINLNDATPAAPAGKTNVKWQADALSPRNVSAYIDTPAIAHVSETPAGTLNGANKVFTLSFTPAPGSLLLALNGVAQFMGTDYTISGTAITYTVAPRTSDLHNAWYTH